MIREEIDFSLVDLFFDKFPEPILPSESMSWSPLLQMYQRSGLMNRMHTRKASEGDMGSGTADCSRQGHSSAPSCLDFVYCFLSASN